MAHSRKPKDLDPLAECDRLLFYQGAAFAGLMASKGPGARETNEELWKLLPFIKALVDVGRAHEDELRAAWEEQLQEPMPFGQPPVGLPELGETQPEKGD